MVDSTSPILIITGMHRSGTSLTASLLQSAGVDIGSNLMAPSEGNIQGHFEDLNVVQFHESVLEEHHLSPEGWVTLEQITQIPETLLPKAKRIISEKRNRSGITGWKDPRGTLFLDFWQSQIPEAKFIFLYRAPWEVIDSLYRRGDSIFQESPCLALDTWINYNKAILSFLHRHRKQSLLFNIEEIRKDPKILAKAFSEHLSLSIEPQSEIYNPSLFHSEASESGYPMLIQQFFPEVIKIYQQLNNSSYSNHKDNCLVEHNSKRTFNGRLLLKDWLKVRKLDKFQQTLQAWENDQLKLEQTLQAWEETQNLVRAMESSKFWKLRQFWFRLKSYLGLPIQ